MKTIEHEDFITWFVMQGRKLKYTLPMPSKLIHGDAKLSFMVQAQGNGMYPDIKCGDMLICCWTADIKNGDKIVLFNPTINMMHCKYIRKYKDQTFFENAKKEIFDFAGYKLCGKITSIISSQV